MKNKYLKLICLVCGAAFAFSSCNFPLGGDSHEHTYGEGWETNQTHHWHAATCAHGENKDAYGEHADVDEDGKCDVCSYEVGHTHSFDGGWLSDEENHWKTATCTHTDEIGLLGLHADEDVNGVCDVCEAHVHIINTFGFCIGCDKETKPVDEDVLGSVVYATSARKKHIVGGNIDYKFSGENKTENSIDKMEHVVDYSLGTNGVYLKRSYKNLENQDETQEDWIKALANGGATGITVKKVGNQVIDAQPSSFNGDSLFGYYYAISTLADGYGAENVLKALYEQSQDKNSVREFNETHDKANKKYDFTFKTLRVHETNIVQGDNKGSKVYNVQYNEVAVSFTYDENYALTSLTVDCDCYTNDPGADGGGIILEADVDLDYNPADGSFALRNGAGVDNYTISVTQNTGERGEIALEDGSKYAPSDFTMTMEEEAVTSLDLRVGQDVTLKIVGSPENSYMSFIKNNLVVSVTDQNGGKTTGLAATMHGFDNLNVYPKAAGEYVITLTYGEVVKKVTIAVTGLELGGANRFEILSTDNNAWSHTYEFKASVTGDYIFYLPYGAAVATYTKLDQDDAPIIEDGNVRFDYDADPSNLEGAASFTLSLRKGQTVKLCFKFRDKNQTYTIGYDEPSANA